MVGRRCALQETHGIELLDAEARPQHGQELRRLPGRGRSVGQVPQRGQVIPGRPVTDADARQMVNDALKAAGPLTPLAGSLRDDPQLVPFIVRVVRERWRGEWQTPAGMQPLGR